MIPIEQTAAVLLAAGLSQRFGDGNKLVEPLGGKPLLGHAADLIRSLPFARRIAVVSGDEVAALLGDFERVTNPAPEQGQDGSVRLGLAAAGDARAILLCLADMPAVTADHLRALADAADDITAAISATGGWRSPPLLLPRALAERVSADRPVRASVAGGRLVEVTASAALLCDYDTRADFTAIRHSLP